MWWFKNRINIILMSMDNMLVTIDEIEDFEKLAY